ncbi:MAG: glycosyltransferase family 2 protein [Pleurocapsa sp. SU_196_0]|nr:glycosyltransferase family 2 protein [Pleurocapsa sp. SU_196_0]
MVSVIIPTYQRPEFLRRALRSLRAQQDAIWEAIVVEDGDGRGSSLARGFGDHRIRAYRNPGRGPNDARNAALEVARGSVIAFLDDDDWWQDPFHLHRICQELRHGEALVYRTGWLVTQIEGMELERVPFTLEATRHSLRRDNTLLASGVAYPTVMHDWLGSFDASLGHYWDWDWYLRVTDLGVPLRRIDEPGVCIAVHPGNASSTRHTETRRRDLERLCAKHGLQGIELKNHLHLGLEQPRAPELVSS